MPPSAFTETVENGVNGFRCRSVEEFAGAIGRTAEISPRACREWAVDRYAPSVVGEQVARFLGPLCGA
jgi:hypothetical protein